MIEMRQALAPILGALLTIAACYSSGALLLDHLRLKLLRWERPPLAFLAGAACFHLAVFALFASHVAYRAVVIALIAAPVVRWGLTRPSRLMHRNAADAASKSSGRAPYLVLALVCAAFVVLYLANAWAPESSPDGSGYHLGLVARYLRAHGFERVTTTWYAGLSQGVEMLYAAAFSIGRHSAAALLHFAFLIALAWAMAAYGRRILKPWAGAAGAALVFISPVVGIDASSAYIDAGVAAAAFGAFYLLEIWDESREPRWLIPVGLVAGYACAAKPTAFVMAVYAAGFVACRAKKLRPALVTAAAAALMIGPWLVRSWLWFSNPLAPLGNAWFRNPYFYVFAEQDWAGWLRHYDVPNLWSLPVEVTLRGGLTAGMLGPVFLLAPAGLLALRYRAGRRLLAAGLVMLLPYPANIGTRFLIPCLPFFALALTLAIGERPAVLSVLMAIHALISWPPHLRKYAPQAWSIQHTPIRAALRIESQDAYLRRVDPDYVAARLIEAHVPAGEPVLALNGIAHAYTTRDVRVSFEAAANQLLGDILQTGWSPVSQPSRVHALHFAAVRAQQVRVVETAQGSPGEQWYVHEMRVYSGGMEVARRPEWRLRAWPNPWEVQLAFDNSPATRWRSAETAVPGMYLEVDFGSPQTLDEVRLETSPDFGSAQFKVEIFENGWKPLPTRLEHANLVTSRGLRRMATRELKLRGVQYLLLRPNEPGADDVADDPEGWGLNAVAKDGNATLYQVSP